MPPSKSRPNVAVSYRDLKNYTNLRNGHPWVSFEKADPYEEDSSRRLLALIQQICVKSAWFFRRRRRIREMVKDGLMYEHRDPVHDVVSER